MFGLAIPPPFQFICESCDVMGTEDTCWCCGQSLRVKRHISGAEQSAESLESIDRCLESR
jgi:hypothetical protein